MPWYQSVKLWTGIIALVLAWLPTLMATLQVGPEISAFTIETVKMLGVILLAVLAAMWGSDSALARFLRNRK
jgi:hypothetical protein